MRRQFKNKKKQLNISLSPYILSEIDDVIMNDASQFAGYSDFITIAAMELIQKIKASHQDETSNPLSVESEYFCNVLQEMSTEC